MRETGVAWMGLLRKLYEKERFESFSTYRMIFERHPLSISCIEVDKATRMVVGKLIVISIVLNPLCNKIVTGLEESPNGR